MRGPRDAGGRLAVTIETRQRASLGRGTGSAFLTPTHAHVPGSVLRGAIARAWIDRYGRPDDMFRDVFDGKLRFGPAFAERTDLRPLSVRSCKYGPEHCGPSWYWDEAFPVPAEVSLPAGWAGGHWERGRGEVVCAVGIGLPVTGVTSTAIEHGTGTAAESQLFSRGAIETGTVLRGFIAGDAQTLAVLAKALIELDRMELGGRSSVFGSAHVSVDDAPPPAEPAGAVAVRLSSPAFLVDPAGRPHLDLRRELRLLGVAGKIGSPWYRALIDGTGGFHGASRMPKPVDVGLAAGTTVVVHPAPGDLAVLAGAVAAGIGLRRAEGFGWVTLADRPWEYPEAASGGVPGAYVDEVDSSRAAVDEGGFDRLRRGVRALRLSDQLTRWLIARLGEPLGTRVAVDAAMAQPGATGLTGQQRAAVAAVLQEPPALRRRLADELAEGAGR